MAKQLARKLLSAILVILICETGAFAQGAIVGGVALNEILNGFTHRIQDIIAQAGGEAQQATVVAAGQANILVNNIAFTYKDTLNETVKTTDVALTNQLQKIDTVLYKLEKGTKSDIDSTLAELQQIALTIPISRVEPQLTSQAPRVASIASEQIVLKLDGVFYYAKDSGYEPTATLNGKTIAASTSTNRLMFVLKSDELKSDPHKIIINSIEVTVPYKRDCWLCLWTKQVAKFNLLLGVLPGQAGNVVVQATAPVTRVENDHRTSPYIGLSSQDTSDRNQPVCDPSPIPPGWSVVPGSIQMINLHEIGGSRKYSDWDEKGPLTASNQVCWSVQTYQHNHGTDGNVSFQLDYQLTRTVSEDRTSQITSLEMNWGDTKSVNLPEGATKWLVRYTPFDAGRTVELSSPGSTEPPFLEVGVPSTGVLSIKTAPPPDL